MSLMLRKEGQVILDQHKIPNFHVGINQYNTLQIKSECGKPFVTIQGIQFTGKVPTPTEITYAVELLDGFLATHILLIQDYLAAKIAFATRKPPINPDPKTISDLQISIDSHLEWDDQAQVHAMGHQGHIAIKEGPVQHTYLKTINLLTNATKVNKGLRLKPGGKPTAAGFTKYKHEIGRAHV